MSRAFVNEDAGSDLPKRDYHLPERDDPDFDRQAARALLEAARIGETGSAEIATGYYWGEPRLIPYVRDILIEARAVKRRQARAGRGALSRAAEAMSDWVQLATFATGFEADLAQQSLTEAEIPCLLSGNQAGMFGAGYQGPVVGGIKLYVPSSAIDAAKDVLDLAE